MTGCERIRCALSFEKADFTAVNPEIIQHSLQLTGIKHSVYSTDPEALAAAQLKTLEHYDYDAVYISSDNYILNEAFGGEVIFPEDEPPRLKSVAFKGNDVGSLKELTPESGRVGVILKAAEICRKALGDRVYVKTNIDSAPFSAAACVVGPEKFLMAVCDGEDWVDDVLNFCTEQIVRYGCLAAECGAHGLAFGDSVSSLISRDMYEELAFPYAKKAIDRLKKETGLPVFYHICGDTNRILDLMCQTGADCIEIDSCVDIRKARELAEGVCCVEGNVSTIEALLEGKPEDVQREAGNVLETILFLFVSNFFSGIAE